MKTSYLSILFLAFTLFACNKDDDGDDDQPASAAKPSAPQVEISGTSASLIAVQTGSTIDNPIIGPITQFIGTGIGVFFDGNGGFSNAGTVMLEGEELSKQGNNSYILTPGTSNPTGVSFSAPISWGVSGNGSIPSITYNFGNGVPEIGNITPSLSTVKLSDGVTFGVDVGSTYTDLNSPDSIMYNVIGTKNVVTKVLAGNVTSATFTKDEIANVGKGAGYVQIAAYNYTVEDFSGYKVAFVNEGVFTKSVTFD